MGLIDSVNVNVGGNGNVIDTISTYVTKVLKPNIINGKNILSQDMMPIDTGANTKYVIKYNYTLSENITVPDNCILEFDGGSISANGETIDFNNCSIIADNYSRIFDNIIPTSDTELPVSLCWFGVSENSNTNGATINAINGHFKNLYLPNGTYDIEVPIMFTNKKVIILDGNIYYNGSVSSEVKAVTVEDSVGIFKFNGFISGYKKKNNIDFSLSRTADVIGLCINHVNNSSIYISNVNYFNECLRVSDTKDDGCCYNKFFLQALWNGNRIIRIYQHSSHPEDSSSISWCNENIFIGGRLYCTSDWTNEHGADAKCAVYIAGADTGDNYNKCNQLMFLHTSMEGFTNKAIYARNIMSCSFIGCRNEATNFIKFVGTCTNNIITGMYENIDISKSNNEFDIDECTRYPLNETELPQYFIDSFNYSNDIDENGYARKWAFGRTYDYNVYPYDVEVQNVIVRNINTRKNRLYKVTIKDKLNTSAQSIFGVRYTKAIVDGVEINLTTSDNDNHQFTYNGTTYSLPLLKATEGLVDYGVTNHAFGISISATKPNVDGKPLFYVPEIVSEIQLFSLNIKNIAIWSVYTDDTDTCEYKTISVDINKYSYDIQNSQIYSDRLYNKVGNNVFNSGDFCGMMFYYKDIVGIIGTVSQKIRGRFRISYLDSNKQPIEGSSPIKDSWYANDTWVAPTDGIKYSFCIPNGINATYVVITTSVLTDNIISVFTEKGVNPIIQEEIAFVKSGSTRPTTTYLPIGYEFFDTSAGKSVYWNGVKWVKADGTDA